MMLPSKLLLHSVRLLRLNRAPARRTKTHRIRKSLPTCFAMLHILSLHINSPTPWHAAYSAHLLCRRQRTRPSRLPDRPDASRSKAEPKANKSQTHVFPLSLFRLMNKLVLPPAVRPSESTHSYADADISHQLPHYNKDPAGFGYLRGHWNNF